jgi:hypothetical protein
MQRNEKGDETPATDGVYLHATEDLAAEWSRRIALLTVTEPMFEPEGPAETDRRTRRIGRSEHDVVEPVPNRWVTVDVAARVLHTTPEALRKRFGRSSIRSRDGVQEAELDGVHARKFGATWKVRFSDAWCAMRTGRRP